VQSVAVNPIRHHKKTPEALHQLPVFFYVPPGYLLLRGHATIERKRELQEELWIFTEPSALPVPM
jgi:hypothetical protein